MIPNPTVPIHPSRPITDEDVFRTREALEAFLRSEVFAVQTYDVVLARLVDPELREALREVRGHHADHVAVLGSWLADFGGSMTFLPGPCGAFANAFHRVVAATDEGEALAALYEGEVFAERDYVIDLVEFTPTLREDVGPSLLESQRELVARLGALIDARGVIATVRTGRRA